MNKYKIINIIGMIIFVLGLIYESYTVEKNEIGKLMIIGGLVIILVNQTMKILRKKK